MVLWLTNFHEVKVDMEKSCKSCLMIVWKWRRYAKNNAVQFLFMLNRRVKFLWGQDSKQVKPAITRLTYGSVMFLSFFFLSMFLGFDLDVTHCGSTQLLVLGRFCISRKGESKES